MGDGFLATAKDAVAFSLEFQKALTQRNASAGVGRRFRMRVGVHAGDVVVRGNEIEGTNVVTAARAEPLADLAILELRLIAHYLRPR